jgi:hypothetical protein
MSVWLHRKAKKEAARGYTTDVAECPKNKHYMRMEVIGIVPGDHRETNFCACDGIAHTRTIV